MRYTRKSEKEAAGVSDKAMLTSAGIREVRRRLGNKKDTAVIDAIGKHWHLSSIGFVERAATHIEQIKDSLVANGKDAYLVSNQELAEINQLPEEDRMEAIENRSELRKAILKAEIFGGESLARFHEAPYIKGNVCIYITRNKITMLPELSTGTVVRRMTGPQKRADVWYEDSADLIDAMLVSGAVSYSAMKNKWLKFVQEMSPMFRSHTNIIVQCPASITNFIAEECVGLGCQFYVLETDGKVYKPAYAMTDILRAIDEPTSNIKLKLMSLTVGKRIIWPIEDDAMADRISAKLLPLIEMIRKNGYEMKFQYGRFVVDSNLYYVVVKTEDPTLKPSAGVTV